MTTKRDLNYFAKDSATGAAIASRYMGAGNALVNSYPVTTTDVAATALIAYAAGEEPFTLAGGGSYTIPDPQAGVDEPSFISVHTAGGLETITMPANPYAGMCVTIKDLDGSANTNNIVVVPNGTDQLEIPTTPGTYVTGPTSTRIITAGGSVTWRYVTNTGGAHKWVITAKF